MAIADGSRPLYSIRLACEEKSTDMSSGSIPITAAGLRRLKAELKQLQTVERTRISREIEVARAHGDLRENAVYHAA